MKVQSIHDLFRDYQRRLDVRAVLAHYGAQNCSERLGADGTTEIVHSCLLDRVEPHHAHGDATPSASVNVEKGLYCCYAYWSGTVFQLVQKLEGTGPEGALEVVTPYLAGATQEVAEIRKRVARAFSEKTAPPPPLSSYSEKVLDAWSCHHPYMRIIRGISEEAQLQLGIGYDVDENRIVFPHWWHGDLVGWQKRVIPASPDGLRWPPTVPDYPKYKNSSGFPKRETLYCHDKAQGHDKVLVVESPMSVAKACHLGLDIPVLATFGASVSEVQIELLRDFSQVLVWFDDDPAGHAGERKLVEGLYRHTSVLVVSPERGRDLGDYTTGKEAHEKIETAVPAARWLRRK